MNPCHSIDGWLDNFIFFAPRRTLWVIVLHYAPMKTIFELDLVSLPKWHRACSIAVLVIILFGITLIFMGIYNAGLPGLEVIAAVFYTITVLLSAVLTGFTQHAMGHNIFVSVIWALASFLLSFLVLLSTSSTAGMILKLAGAKIGTLGVSRDDLDRLRHRHCRAFGYSREGIGLLDPCPECTRVPQVI